MATDNASKGSAVKDLRQCNFNWASSERHDMAVRYEMGPNLHFVSPVV